MSLEEIGHAKLAEFLIVGFMGTNRILKSSYGGFISAHNHIAMC